MKKILCTVIGVFFLQATAALADLDPLQDYDNFNAKKYNGCKWCINTDKWLGLERGPDGYNGEVSRKIQGKRARLAHRSWGGDDSDAGTVTGRNRLKFRDSEKFSGVCFTPRVLKYELDSCAENPSNGSVWIRYTGNFYDADTNPSSEGDDGLVSAWIGLRRFSDSADKQGIFRVEGRAWECEGTDCDTDAWSTYDNIDDPDLFFGTVKANKNKQELCVGYDRSNHELVFSFGKDVRPVGAAYGLPALAADVDGDFSWHVLEGRTEAESCTAGSISSYVDGDVDNVKIREFP